MSPVPPIQEACLESLDKKEGRKPMRTCTRFLFHSAA